MDPINPVILLSISNIASDIYQPPNSNIRYSLRSRGATFKSTLFFGLQYVLKKYLTGQVVTLKRINDAKTFFGRFYPKREFNEVEWMYVLSCHAGCLPVRIRSVAEGSLVATGDVLLTVESTDPRAAWLVMQLHDVLSQLWYPITVATRSLALRREIGRYLHETSDNYDSVVELMFSDYGMRGSSSMESAELGGSAFLLCFGETNNLIAVNFVPEYYGPVDGSNIDDAPPAGISSLAMDMEHSTVITWGRNKEIESFRNVISKTPDGCALSVIVDSYDMEACVRDIVCGALKHDILKMDGQQKSIVICPDSGDPVQMPMKVLQLLDESYGSQVTVNSKGFKVLPRYLRVVQGDGLNMETVLALMLTLKENKWSVENVYLGAGGEILQNVNADMLRLRFELDCGHKDMTSNCRACLRTVNREGPNEVTGRRNLIGDPLSSIIAKSRLCFESLAKGFALVMSLGPSLPKQAEMQPSTPPVQRKENEPDSLQTVFVNGVLIRQWSFEQIRERVEASLQKS